MKSILSFFAFLTLFTFVSCKSDATATEDASATSTANTVSTPMPEGAVSDAVATGNPNAADEMPVTGPTTTMELVKSEYNFGTVKEGDIVETTMTIKNTGTEPLVITNCRASCGCTTPVCPTSPIAPGQTVDVPVKFDTKGKPGTQVKDVTITANTVPAQTKFKLQGTVEKANATK